MNQPTKIRFKNLTYGLENSYSHSRSLAVWLIEKGYVVKDINPALAYDQCKSAPTFQKNDEYDAYAVATVLINQLNTLPDAKPEDNHWTLSQLVNRRYILVKDGIRLENGLHEQISIAYPNYHKFFCEIDTKTALYFWKTYPSLMHLQYKMARDFITQSPARCLENQKDEMALLEGEIKRVLQFFDYKLTTIPGVSIATASKLIAEIGDIRRFPNANKLARYSGVAPIKFSSAGKGRAEFKARQSSTSWIILLPCCFYGDRSEKWKAESAYISCLIISVKSAKVKRNCRLWSVLCVGWSISFTV